VQIEGDKLSVSDWERIRKELGLRSDIKTEEQYLAEVAAGIAEAKRFSTRSASNSAAIVSTDFPLLSAS
jgi:hypothetical protein